MIFYPFFQWRISLLLLKRKNWKQQRFYISFSSEYIEVMDTVKIILYTTEQCILYIDGCSLRRSFLNRWKINYECMFNTQILNEKKNLNLLMFSKATFSNVLIQTSYKRLFEIWKVGERNVEIRLTLYQNQYFPCLTQLWFSPFFNDKWTCCYWWEEKVMSIVKHYFTTESCILYINGA